ncbi:polyprenyl synthetase family protein [Rothia sp. LK2588]|uniref:polyprenyl synthetase family protein n=1 Tax=Rothia sp. LK2588 TaxID=3114369 RepID=UPI0034CF2922
MPQQHAARSELTQLIEAEERTYLELLESELARFFEAQERLLADISEESLPLLESIRSLSTGGKRLRALLCYWGWRGAGGAVHAPEVVTAGAALELFQSSALIHDDIIDNSDTRRGAPAVHKQFESMHRTQSWRADAASFGVSAAIIVGDLCLSWSEQVFASIGEKVALGTEARRIFDLMRTEVMSGQYLDVLGEVTDAGDSVALQRAQHVIRYKSAKYSCEHPLALGGALALGTQASHDHSLLHAYREFALPLGEGFQLRDDLLGVFGSPQETGKPAGDDLKEGKRTVLIALTHQLASAEQWQRIDEGLGDQGISPVDIAELQQIITDSGAREQVEASIAEKENTVSQRLEQLPVDDTVRLALERIVGKALHRTS